MTPSRWLLPLLALGGVAAVFYVANRDMRPVPPPQVVAPPAVAGFPDYIAGSGIIESRTRNIAVSTPVAGVVTRIWPKVGSVVNAGEPLFRLDDRDLVAQLATRRTALAAAKARVGEAEATVGDVRVQLRLAESITDRRAISEEDLSKRRFAVQLAEARLRSARADVGNAEAAIEETATNLERLTVRAPITGQLLQVNVRLGEFASTGALATPLMVMGAVDRLNVRIDIDENDAWRFRPDSKARAHLRGNRALATDLAFEYVEPYVVPKRSLTGESQERVDTRVLQVVYSFPAGAMPAYVGQLVDVFIDAPGRPPGEPADGGAAAPADPGGRPVARSGTP